MSIATNALPEWQDDALCRQVDPELFYPEKGGNPEPAKAICRTCDVTDKCLQYALNNHEQFGVWGGKTERERRQLLAAPRGASVHPIQQRRRTGLAEHHQTIAAMLDRPTPATWAQIGAAVGWSGDAVKKYWHRQQAAAQQQEQEMAA